MNETTMPTSSIRRELAAVLRAIDAGEIIHVTHYDRPVAVMLPPDLAREALEALRASSSVGE